MPMCWCSRVGWVCLVGVRRWGIDLGGGCCSGSSSGAWVVLRLVVGEFVTQLVLSEADGALGEVEDECDFAFCEAQVDPEADFLQGPEALRGEGVRVDCRGW